jgi:hypothetical protein
MSDSSSEIYTLHKNDGFQLSELYNATKNNSDGYGIEGYKISKKSDLLIIHEHKIEKAKKKDLFYDISKKSNEPSPSVYSPTHEKLKKDYWGSGPGTFQKSPRKTYIDEILKSYSKNPGPGDYIKESSSPQKRSLYGTIE